nr:uncharacterized protein LOC126526282 [Dermacentor andersoni]
MPGNKTQRELLKGSLDDLEYHFRHKRTSELLCYRSQRGLLDIDNIEPSLFRQQFGFEKEDFNDLFRALKRPDTMKSAQNVIVRSREALCVTLRHLAYPNRCCDLEAIFGRHSSVMPSVASEVIFYTVSEFQHLLEDCNNHDWLCPATVGELANAIQNHGAALTNRWAFIHGTARPICRPKRNQRDYFSGHKRMHILKYQSAMCSNGIVCQLDGPCPGRQHDESRLPCVYSSAVASMRNIYGDPAYPLKPVLMKLYGGSSLTTMQLAFNSSDTSDPGYCLRLVQEAPLGPQPQQNQEDLPWLPVVGTAMLRTMDERRHVVWD